jgi:hypothetical protein
MHLDVFPTAGDRFQVCVARVSLTIIFRTQHDH